MLLFSVCFEEWKITISSNTLGAIKFPGWSKLIKKPKPDLKFIFRLHLDSKCVIQCNLSRFINNYFNPSYNIETDDDGQGLSPYRIWANLRSFRVWRYHLVALSPNSGESIIRSTLFTLFFWYQWIVAPWTPPFSLLRHFPFGPFSRLRSFPSYPRGGNH